MPAGMHEQDPFEIFIVVAPGLELAVAAEARAAGFGPAQTIPGGVTLRGDWNTVWRANLVLRGAVRVLVRLGSFRAMHLAQLDKRARRFPWDRTLRADEPVRVETTCRRSRIYHAGAATQRIETAIRESVGCPIAADAAVVVKARIEDDLVTISIDSSGAPLHQRGLKQAVGKAPLRESLAAPILRECGYAGTETVVDPMCGSGTFVLEAAEIALGLVPGRARAFAFEHLAGFDPTALAAMKARESGDVAPLPGLRFYGYDRDEGAIRNSRANAERAGIEPLCHFAGQPISALRAPPGPPGLVVVNPPYGGRIGQRGALHALYASLGTVLRREFGGWRVGLVTTEPALARATGLPFLPMGAPIAHGGLKLGLYRTAPLAGDGGTRD